MFTRRKQGQIGGSTLIIDPYRSRAKDNNITGVSPKEGERWTNQLGGERNKKQRIPVNSITSQLVLKSIYASGSTGPFFADNYLNI